MFTKRFLNGQLHTNSYLIAKNICAFFVSPFLASVFSLKPVFSTKEFFENLSMKKDPLNQIIRKWPPKGIFVDFLEKWLGMNAGLWSSVYVWFWIFENFFEDFWDLRVLRSYFYLSFELCYQCFDVKFLLLSWDASVYRHAREW